MFKVIELDIDPELSGDSRVTEIAWVEYPAIEQDMIYFGRYQFYIPPQYVADRACQAIKENDQRGNPAGTQVGKVRAQQLCQRKEVSLETIKRMKSYLERAKTYNTNNWDDNGTISYGLWGGGGSGDDALTWVDSILSSIENQEQKKQAFVENAGGFSVGQYVSWTFAGRGEGYDRARGRIIELRVQGEVQVPGTDFKLNATEDRPVALIETEDGSVVGQYTDNLRQIQKPENFVYPSGGETRDEFISRCVSYVMAEGKSQDEALGQCYGMWEQQFAPDKVSFDWDGTLTTERGIRALENERRRGSIIYIVSARNRTNRDMIDLSLDYDIPGSRIFTVGSNKAKVAKVQELGIKRHYDNNAEVRNELGSVGLNFDYDISGLPQYASYPQTAMTESVLGFTDCGCSKEEFKIVGYMDGIPVFDNPDEAVKWGEEQGCQGYHTHTDENGNEVYMGCTLHSMMDDLDFALDEYSEEELEAYHALMKIRDEDYHTFQEFIYRIDGRTELQVKGLNLTKATRFFRYDRKVAMQYGPDRPECMQIEGKYFRRFEIDLMRNLALQYGHKRQPYSKFLWKFGPNCVHAWRKVLVQGENIADEGWAEGQAGKAMKDETPNNGYYSLETQRKSQIRYLIDNKDRFSQSIKLEDELEPIAYVDGYPVYEVLSLAVDASLALGCGGIYENIIHDGRERFMACSRTAMKADTQQKQTFAAVEDQRMIYTPLMIPRILIPRIDEFGEKYYVTFTEEAVRRAQRKYMLEGRLRNTNLEHSDQKFTDVVMVESWIVDGENDKAYQLGFTTDQVPKGTWMGGFQVLETPQGDDIWENYVKPGKVKGASVEGSFILNFSAEKDPDYLLLNQIINILKNIDDER